MQGSQQNEEDPAGRDALAPPELPGITLTAAPLSRGPFSAVYRGWDRVHRYDVIVKVLQTGGDPVAADRFRREAAVMAKLRHPNIVALYSFQDGDPSALVMEYVPGQTLDALIAATGPLPVARAVQIIEGIAAALDLIHAENVVHRDVKPSNILLPKHGPARLTDFGVAHIDTAAPLTIRGDMLGTIEYASPEQVQGVNAPDARSDVYSLAAVAYFALTGKPPFPAADSSMQSHLSVMHQQVFSEPPLLRSLRTDLAPGVDAAVLRGLAKDPAARYPSAGQLASALRSALVAASGAPEQGAIAANSRRTLALSGALAGAALIAGGAILFSQEHSAPVSGHHAPPAVAAQPAPIASVPAPKKIASVPVPKKIASVPAPKKLAAQMPAAEPVKTQPKALRVAALPAYTAGSTPGSRSLPLRHTLSAASVSARSPLLIASMPRATVRIAKRAVTERPKYRRHPALVATRLKPAPFRLARQQTASAVAAAFAAKHRPAPRMALLSVFARQDVILHGGAARTEAIPAQQVTVDGHSMPSLTLGGWAAVPAGKHLVAFAPQGQSGYGRSPGLWVTLAPGARVSRQILLPMARPILATTRTRPSMVASAAPAPVHPVVPVQPALKTLASEPQVVPPLPIATVMPAASIVPAVAWYTVSGWIVRNPTAPKPTLVRTSAYWVKVDGTPNIPLALGQWAELPAGKHTIEFQPTNGVGVGAKTWNIDLAPQGHLDQQIPLPPMIVTPN